MARRYVDVNVFVYWLGGHPEYGQRALEWIREIEKAPNGAYITASLTVFELVVIMSRLTGARLGDTHLITTILEALGSLKGLKIVETLYSDYVEALNLMKTYKLDFEDAIHLAVAMRVNAKEIVSNDADFDNTPLKRVF
ncbi:PilT protein domain protein [Pyrolobus fumarii 1A]|uniref:PilT protein domain protein n=1 Tax=Pyrolobus fumarii (strain DSM 11204 / 1A) TaxID=694429 RepID=G0EFV6_PYRF1|nr:type II toxin-antitoxin system VapC family toxin [Pyrolobus fumarii]AEM39057.1 PilT protein domain protein [Pyrolobus fumarii 1A]